MSEQRQGNLLAETRSIVEKKRGRRWAFPDLQGNRIALIGCEVSRFGLSIAPKLRSAIPRIDWLAKTLRASGGPVFWSNFSKNAFDGPSGTILGNTAVAMMRPRLKDPAWMQINEGIQDTSLDRIVSRPGYAAIGNELRKILNAEEIDTILLAGAETEGTIDSTARAAASAGFKVIVISDCCASANDDAHISSMAALHHRIADVRAADEVVTELRRNIAK